MTRRIPFYILWDIKTWLQSIAGIIVILTIVASYYYYPEIMVRIKALKFDSEITGQIISVEAHENLKQTIIGSKVSKQYFTISYSYKVGDSTYTKAEKVFINNKDKLIFKNILDNDNQVINVRYDSSEPANSMVYLYD